MSNKKLILSMIPVFILTGCTMRTSSHRVWDHHPRDTVIIGTNYNHGHHAARHRSHRRIDRRVYTTRENVERPQRHIRRHKMKAHKKTHVRKLHKTTKTRRQTRQRSRQ